MPRGDRTGPSGYGSMTGRRAGYCAGYQMPGFANMGYGYGQGPGFGFGRGGGFRGWRNRFTAAAQPFWGRGYYAPPTPTVEQEAEGLKAEASWLKDQLEAINKRIEELEQD